jgi:hypothetical protein
VATHQEQTGETNFNDLPKEISNQSFSPFEQHEGVDDSLKLLYEIL